MKIYYIVSYIQKVFFQKQLPINVVEVKGLKEPVQYLEPKYIMPLRVNVTKHINPNIRSSFLSEPGPTNQVLSGWFEYPPSSSLNKYKTVFNVQGQIEYHPF